MEMYYITKIQIFRLGCMGRTSTMMRFWKRARRTDKSYRRIDIGAYKKFMTFESCMKHCRWCNVHSRTLNTKFCWYILLFTRNIKIEIITLTACILVDFNICREIAIIWPKVHTIALYVTITIDRLENSWSISFSTYTYIKLAICTYLQI